MKGEVMERLTSNKNVSEMGIYELAHNSCYTKDGKARYRDYDTDMDARELTRKLLIDHAGGDDAFDSDEDFDEWMVDYLQYGMDSIEGLIALFYRNLWAMADLRERLKEYEDLEEQWKLLKLPCAIGDIVYTNKSIQGWYSKDEPRKGWVEQLEINGVDNFMNVSFGNGRLLRFKFSEIGKTVFLTKEQAEAALHGD